MRDFKELENLEKIKTKRVRMPDDVTCYVCGCNRSQARFRRYNEYYLCEKHYSQLEKYHKIIDPTPRKHKKDEEELKCCLCGELKMGNIDNKPYCRKHYIQLSRHGEIKSTIYDKNEWIDCGDYYECVLKNKNSVEVGRTKIDKKDYDSLKDFKLYMKVQDSKSYAYFSERVSSKKYAVHRYLLGMSNEKYTIDKVVDHINGDSLDNRRSNLRICTQYQNAQNNRKRNKIVGVRFIKSYNGTTTQKWMAQICSNYKTIHLGYYDTQSEAVLARIKKEKEICGEYGPNKDLYYLLDHPSPIEELNNILGTSEGA